MTTETGPHPTVNHTQLVNMMRRHLLGIAGRPEPLTEHRSLFLLAAQDGRIKPRPMPLGMAEATGAPLLQELTDIGTFMSTNKAQVVLQTVLDDTYCGAMLICPVSQTLRHVTRVGGAPGSQVIRDGLCAMAVSLLDGTDDPDEVGDEAVVIYDGGSRTAQETPVNLGDGEFREIMSALWHVVTAIDDSLAATAPADSAKLAMQMFLSGRSGVGSMAMPPGDANRVDLMRGLNSPGGPAVWRSLCEHGSH